MQMQCVKCKKKKKQIKDYKHEAIMLKTKTMETINILHVFQPITTIFYQNKHNHQENYI